MNNKPSPTKEFIDRLSDPTFKPKIIVDNDCIEAYYRGKLVFDFEGEGPQGALVNVLKALGAKVDFA
jgi:hypothetical protein